MNYFFTADQHYGHANIIKYCNRPFSSVGEMDEALITFHNEVVGEKDVVIHAGDFSWLKSREEVYKRYVNRLIGQQVFLIGSHDYWLQPHNHHSYIWEKKIGKQFIVVCHYAMRTWARSHYNSWQLYGHSHGKLPPVGKQHDVGVDNNGFYPVSLDEIIKIMNKRDDNPNLVKR